MLFGKRIEISKIFNFNWPQKIVFWGQLQKKDCQTWHTRRRTGLRTQSCWCFIDLVDNEVTELSCKLEHWTVFFIINSYVSYQERAMARISIIGSAAASKKNWSLNRIYKSTFNHRKIHALHWNVIGLAQYIERQWPGKFSNGWTFISARIKQRYYCTEKYKLLLVS